MTEDNGDDTRYVIEDIPTGLLVLLHVLVAGTVMLPEPIRPHVLAAATATGLVLVLLLIAKAFEHRRRNP